MNTGNININYFVLLNIKSKFIGTANPKNNHYKICYNLMELNTMQQYTISETIEEHKKTPNTIIDGPLAKILIENGVPEYKLNYYALIENNLSWNIDLITDITTEPGQYFFNGILLKEDPKTWNDILFIPSSERQQSRAITELTNNIALLNTILDEEIGNINSNLEKIESELNLMNYLKQH